MIDIGIFRDRYKAYKYMDYAGDFYGFWRWKVEIENNHGHILDEGNRQKTHRRLSSLLPRWLTYRPKDSSTCLRYLKESLEKISALYNEIRDIDLLNFNKIPDEKLKVIWHELGCTKEENGKKNKRGAYYVVAITKPLMFLWGQTLAFDSVVRGAMPNFSIPGVKKHVWVYKTWKRVMSAFQQNLMEQPKFVKVCKLISERELGSGKIVPYGQFLDLYYWVGGRMFML